MAAHNYVNDIIGPAFDYYYSRWRDVKIMAQDVRCIPLSAAEICLKKDALLFTDHFRLFNSINYSMKKL